MSEHCAIRALDSRAPFDDGRRAAAHIDGSGIAVVRWFDGTGYDRTTDADVGGVITDRAEWGQ